MENEKRMEDPIFKENLMNKRKQYWKDSNNVEKVSDLTKLYFSFCYWFERDRTSYSEAVSRPEIGINVCLELIIGIE